MDAATPAARDAGRPWSRRPAVTACLCAVLLALAAPAPASHADDPPAAGGATAVSAQNLSITVQVLWQVQEGCARYCTGTQQLQTADQTATTLQVATATTGGAGPAAAANTSATIQVIVQTQLGCVAFCYGTAQTQDATQHTETAQLATAVSAALASASNDPQTTQLVLQFQQGCQSECHDTSTAKTSAQTQAADTVAVSAAGAAPLEAVLAWIAAVSAQATVDVVEQHDVAACLEHCDGDVQVQVSVQSDTTVQETEASDEQDAAAASPAAPVATDDAAAAPAAPVAAPAQASPVVVIAAIARPGGPHVTIRPDAAHWLRWARCARPRTGELSAPHFRHRLRGMVGPKLKPRPLVTGGILCGS